MAINRRQAYNMLKGLNDINADLALKESTYFAIQEIADKMGHPLYFMPDGKVLVWPIEKPMIFMRDWQTLVDQHEKPGDLCSIGVPEGKQSPGSQAFKCVRCKRKVYFKDHESLLGDPVCAECAVKDRK